MTVSSFTVRGHIRLITALGQPAAVPHFFLLKYFAQGVLVLDLAHALYNKLSTLGDLIHMHINVFTCWNSN